MRRSQVIGMALLSGAAGIVIGVGLLLWPVSENGVTGNALRPDYTAGVWFAYAPLAETRPPGEMQAEIRQAPRDFISNRRGQSAMAVVAGLLAGGLALGLVADAQRRATQADPGAAIFDFLTRLGAEGVAKRDTSDAIAVPGPLRDELHDALAVLLQRAQHAGAVRADITAADLVALFKGLLDVVLEDGDPGRAGRVLALVIDGLRPPSR